MAGHGYTVAIIAYGSPLLQPDMTIQSAQPSHPVFLTRPDLQSLQKTAEDVLPATICQIAQQTIKSWPDYQPTPLQALSFLASQLGVGELYCKDESSRFGLGSFKSLGGAYAVAQLAKNRSHQDKLTVACATAGNHGKSVAWGAQLAGVECVIFLHENVSQSREDAIAAYGARIVRVPGNYDDSVRHCAQQSSANGWTVISDTSWEGYSEIPRQVMAGYTVIADEIRSQLPKAPTHVFLQGGVGGLAAAMMAQLIRSYPDEEICFIVVEPDEANCLKRSLENRKFTTVSGPMNTSMAGLACGVPSMIALEILQQGSNIAMTVGEQVVVDCMRILARPQSSDPSIVAGASGAAGLAGLVQLCSTQNWRKLTGLGPQSRVLVINSEGATDPQTYRSLIGD